MTLIITAFVGADTTIQVSDRRISYSGQNPPQPHDRAKKLIVYVRPTERFAVSYTGLAEFVGVGAPVSIESWLVNTLQTVPSSEPIGVVLSTLTRGLDAQVSRARSVWHLSDTHARLSVVLTGFEQTSGQRVLVCISNFEQLGTEVHFSKKGEDRFRTINPPGTNDFVYGSFTARSAVFNGLGTVTVHGDRSALSRTSINRLLGSMRDARLRKLDRTAYRDLLVSALREAADARPGLIGPICLSCIMSRDAPMWEVGSHHPGGYDGTWPQLVFPGGSMDTGTVSRDEVGVADAAARLATGVHLDLNTASYRAFLDRSSEVRELADVVRKVGVEVSSLGMLDRDIAMLTRAGITRTDLLEALVRSTTPWAKAYIQECVRDVADLAAQGHTMLIDNNLIVAYLVAAARRRMIGEGGLIAYFGVGRASRLAELGAKYVP